MDKLCLGCMEYYEGALPQCPHCGYGEGTLAAEAYHLPPGTILQGRYLIGRVLGFGSFGVTYIGYDQKLKWKVAIKEYLPGEFSTRTPGEKEVTVYTGERKEQFSSGKDKFLEEARKLGKFRSEPHIIHIYDCFEENMTAYIVMEFMKGETLKDKLARQGALPVEEATEILTQILEGLKRVHCAGMLHRDIAPDNIYITEDGGVKLFDFGAARYATTKRSRSLTVQIKAGYTPVEQYQSHGNQGPWTDVYAAAAVYYKMLTNLTPEESLNRKIKDTLIPPSRKGVKLKKSVETALMNALNVEVEERTPSVEQFETEILASEVHRLEVRIRKRDVGRWPVWLKVLIGILTASVSAFLILLATGVISFDIGRWNPKELPEGKVRVPNLINFTLEEAKARGQELKFTVKVENKEYSDEIPVDRILSQAIRGGSLIDEETQIGITLSAGVEQTYAPELTGVAKADAQEQLLESGLIADWKEMESFVEPGAVVRQDPEADVVLDTGSRITVYLSQGLPGGDRTVKTVLEDFEGMSWELAGEWAAEHHCYLSRKELVYDEHIPAGVIISQEPQAGRQIAQNEVVRLVVSGGAEKVFVPDVQYMAQENAREQLESAGLTVELQTEASDTIETDQVIRQSVEPNTRAAKGTTVTLIVSSGVAVQNPASGEGGPGGKRTTRPERPVPSDIVQPQLPPAAPQESEVPIQPVAPEPEPERGGDISPEDLGDRLNNLGI